MKLFWRTTIALVSKYAICIADSREINSALIYIHPNAKEPGLFDYLKAGGLKILFELGPKMIIKLLRFDAQAKRVSTKYQSTTKDGYLLGFATRIDKQHHHLGTPLIESLSKYLDASGEGCYLETFKRENVGLYEHFGFNLMEECNVSNGKLKLFAMHREPASH